MALVVRSGENNEDIFSGDTNVYICWTLLRPNTVSHRKVTTKQKKKKTSGVNLQLVLGKQQEEKIPDYSRLSRAGTGFLL